MTIISSESPTTLQHNTVSLGFILIDLYIIMSFYKNMSLDKYINKQKQTKCLSMYTSCWLLSD